MKKHICRQCGSTFEYCRGCLLSPIPHKDAGFCSKDCYEASKNVVIAPEIIEEVILVEEPNQIKEEAEAVVLAEVPIIETTTVAESTIKKETYNAYKKKKKKHR